MRSVLVDSIYGRTCVLVNRSGPGPSPPQARAGAALGYDALMAGFFRIALLAGAAFIVFMVLFRPTELRSIGRRLRVIGFAYVAAILIGAALRLLGFYGT